MKARIALALGALLAGCEAVPALTFTDASTDGTDAASDAGEDAADGGPAESDALEDVAVNTCPDAAAPPATLCCGSVPCVGCSSQGDCNRCSPCSTGDTCCIKPGNVSCEAFGVACP
jgi:hypothetical protein